VSKDWCGVLGFMGIRIDIHGSVPSGKACAPFAHQLSSFLPHIVVVRTNEKAS